MQGVCNVAVSKNASTVAVVGDVKFDVRFAMQTNEVGCGKQRKSFALMLFLICYLEILME